MTRKPYRPPTLRKLTPGEVVQMHKAKTSPAGYEETAQAMLRHITQWKKDHPGVVPRFRWGPDDVAIIGSLGDMGARFAVDNHAHELVRAFNSIGLLAGGDYPTLLMLRVVLGMADIPMESVSLDQLGLKFDYRGQG